MGTDSWWIVAIIFGLALVFGLLFRRGAIRGEYLARYRDPNAPAAIRNIGIVSPLLAVLIIPLLVATSPFAGQIASGWVLPKTIDGLLEFGAAGYFFLSAAIVDVALYRPPAWLVPRWLREDDQRIRWVPPQGTLRDKGLLALAIPAGILGSAFLFAGVYQLISPP